MRCLTKYAVIMIVLFLSAGFVFSQDAQPEPVQEEMAEPEPIAVEPIEEPSAEEELAEETADESAEQPAEEGASEAEMQEEKDKAFYLGVKSTLPLNVVAFKDGLSLLSFGAVVELDLGNNITFVADASYSLTTFFSLFGNSNILFYLPVQAGGKYYFSGDNTGWFAGAGLSLNLMVTSEGTSGEWGVPIGFHLNGGYTVQSDPNRINAGLDLAIIPDNTLIDKLKVFPQVYVSFLW